MPQNEEVIDEGAKEMVELIDGWLIRSWNDADEADVFRTKTKVGREVEKDEIYRTNGTQLSSLLVAAGVEPVDV